jgi:hypothetical protein
MLPLRINAQIFQVLSPNITTKISPANQNQESPEWAKTTANGLIHL